MPVKHEPTKEVHRGIKGGKTGCGFNTQDHPEHWFVSSEKIRCAKNGCKN
jgi:hypothetical protein